MNHTQTPTPSPPVRPTASSGAISPTSIQGGGPTSPFAVRSGLASPELGLSPKPGTGVLLAKPPATLTRRRSNSAGSVNSDESNQTYFTLPSNIETVCTDAFTGDSPRDAPLNLQPLPPPEEIHPSASPTWLRRTALFPNATAASSSGTLQAHTEPAGTPAATPGSTASTALPQRSASPSPSDGTLALSADRILVVANRLPFTFTKDKNGKWTSVPASGGLVSAMKGIQGSRMLWLGWPGVEVAPSEQPVVEALCLEQGCFPIFLSKEIIELYYNGFSNHVLWPLFHYINVNIEDAVSKLDTQWRAYKEANQRFAKAILKCYQPTDVVWIHDYHLMLAPLYLRQSEPRMKLGWFLHTPFPSSEIYRASPFREELLHGVLAADLLGFHIFDYARHFKSACTRILGLEVTHQGVEHHGRFTQVGSFPIGIDASRFVEALDTKVVKDEYKDLKRKFKGMKVLLGIDRLDYIKGIPHKILAVETFLSRHPEWIGKVVLIQIAVPSREGVLEYQRLKSTTHELVGRVNGRFGTLDSVPIHYLDQGIAFNKMCALYRLADVAVVTSLRDGMNLVAFEYVACQRDKPLRKGGPGVLILSEFTGAAQSLGAGAIRVNPWNTNQVADAIQTALVMSSEERHQLFQYSYQHMTTYTAQRWARAFLTDLETACHRTREREQAVPGQIVTPHLNTQHVVEAFSHSKHRLIVLGVVGCLTQKRTKGLTVEQYGQMAKVHPATLNAVKELAADPNTTVLIMTALGRAVVDNLLGSTDAWLVPENGFFIRRGGRDKEWEMLGDNVDLSWVEEILEVLNYFVQRTPRSFIEREESFLSWHYRDSDPDWAKLQARDLLVHLMATPAASHGFEVVRGVRAVQVRPIGVSKGFAAQQCIYDIQKQKSQNVDFILCCGAFLTRDEDLFASLTHSSFLAPELDDHMDSVLDPRVNGGDLVDHDSPSFHSVSPNTPSRPSNSPPEVPPLSLISIPPTVSSFSSAAASSSSSAASSTSTLATPAPPTTNSLTPSVSSLNKLADPSEHSSTSEIQRNTPPSAGSRGKASYFSFRSNSTPNLSGVPPARMSTSPHMRPFGHQTLSPRMRGMSSLKEQEENKILPTRAVFTCTVGRNKPSRAQFHVDNTNEVSALLQQLCRSLPRPSDTPSIDLTESVIPPSDKLLTLHSGASHASSDSGSTDSRWGGDLVFNSMSPHERSV